MRLVALADVGAPIGRLERPANDTGRLTVLVPKRVQHNNPLVEDELGHTVLVAGYISEDLKAYESDKVVGRDVTGELDKSCPTLLGSGRGPSWNL